MRGLIERHIVERQRVILSRLLKAVFHPEPPESVRCSYSESPWSVLAASKWGLCPPFRVDRRWALSPRQRGCQGVNWEHNGKHHTFCTVIPPGLRSAQELLLSRNKKSNQCTKPSRQGVLSFCRFSPSFVMKRAENPCCCACLQYPLCQISSQCHKEKGNSRKSVARNTVLDLMSY